jgi:hypothetical protein
MTSLMNQENRYGVEVSGWDAKECFFVERATLDWGDEGRKYIELQSHVREGCVVFVRLIQRLTGGGNFPVPYRAVCIACQVGEGKERVSVEQLRPHQASDERGQNARGAAARVPF